MTRQDWINIFEARDLAVRSMLAAAESVVLELGRQGRLPRVQVVVCDGVTGETLADCYGLDCARGLLTVAGFSRSNLGKLETWIR